jgi:phage recombination protein Bet
MKFTENEKKALFDGLLKGFTSADQQHFLHVCEHSELDPFRKQIYAIPRGGGGINIVVSIDGLRSIAHRTGSYAGQVGPEWCGTDGVWKDVWLGKAPPAAARTGVFRRGFDKPIYSVATWEQHAGNTPIWRKMGPHMLGIRSEGFSLRRSFPNELAGLYTEDEIEAAVPAADLDQPKQASKNPADRVKELLADKGLEIKTGNEVASPPSEVATFTEDEINNTLIPILEGVDKSFDDLRSDMLKVPGIDADVVNSDPTMWPVDWQGRIEKWASRHAAVAAEGEA